MIKLSSEITPNSSQIDSETDSLFGVTFHTDNDQR